MMFQHHFFTHTCAMTSHHIIRWWQSLRERAKQPNTPSISCLSVGNDINNPTWFNFLIHPPSLFMRQQRLFSKHWWISFTLWSPPRGLGRGIKNWCGRKKGLRKESNKTVLEKCDGVMFFVGKTCGIIHFIFQKATVSFLFWGSFCVHSPKSLFSSCASVSFLYQRNPLLE